eukprot:gene11484-biopygen326
MMETPGGALPTPSATWHAPRRRPQQPDAVHLAALTGALPCRGGQAPPLRAGRRDAFCATGSARGGRRAPRAPPGAPPPPPRRARGTPRRPSSSAAGRRTASGRRSRAPRAAAAVGSLLCICAHHVRMDYITLRLKHARVGIRKRGTTRFTPNSCGLPTRLAAGCFRIIGIDWAKGGGGCPRAHLRNCTSDGYRGRGTWGGSGGTAEPLKGRKRPPRAKRTTLRTRPCSASLRTASHKLRPASAR